MCETEMTCPNHERLCEGEGIGENQRKCGVSSGWVRKTNYARHVRRCREKKGEVVADVEGELEEVEGER